MKLRPIALAFMLAAAPAAFPQFAHAQGGAAGEDALTKAARARFQEGVENFDKGQFEAARAAFTQAYALKKHPAVLLNLAQSCLKSGHFVEAAGRFKEYLNDPQGDKKADAQKGLADARAKLGRLDIGAPNGSDVTVDNDSIGKTPLNEAFDVEAGNHTVRVRLPDGTSSEQKVAVVAGQVLPVKFAAAATVVTPPPGGTTNPENPPPGGGTLNPPGGVTPPGGGNPPPIEQPQTHHVFGSLVPLVVSGAVTIAGFTLGITFAIIKGTANDNYNSVQQQILTAAKKQGIPSQGICGNPPANFANACTTLKSDADAVNQDATVANIGIAIGIIGLAGVAGSLVYYFVGHKEPNSPTTVLAPWMDQHSAGLAFGGRF